MHRFITRYLLANIFNNKLYMSLSFVSKVGLGALMTAGVMSTTIIGNPGKRSSASRVVIDIVREMNPPFLGFYTKYLDCDNIIIRSASVVDDKAFYIASAKIKMMLEHMPMAHKNLVKNGAELHIIGKDQVTSDLPELADQKGVSYVDNGVLTDIDRRTRGVGGRRIRPGRHRTRTASQDTRPAGIPRGLDGRSGRLAGARRWPACRGVGRRRTNRPSTQARSRVG